MKELSIEQKAKAYNKVREKIALRFGSNVAEEIFSEFEMSEDERIRKELIDAILGLWDNDALPMPLSVKRKDEWIAWLEKQGNTNETINKDEFAQGVLRGAAIYLINWIDYNAAEGNMCLSNMECKDIEDSLVSGDWGKIYAYLKKKLEKQGEQKPVSKEYTFKSIPRLLDMIEPTDRAKSYCKKLIDSLQTEGYSVDAKIVGECLKQMNGEKVAMAVMDNEKQDEKKSQRMVSAEAKEALYDKPTDEEMKELLRTEYEKGRADTIAEMYVPTQISPEESLGVSSEKYMDIVDTLTQGGQKPAKWSLEDERVIAIINNALTESNTPPDDYDKVYDWLESLRQKIGG